MDITTLGRYRPSSRLAILQAGILSPLLAVGVVRAGNIFDDDFVPPQRSAPVIRNDALQPPSTHPTTAPSSVLFIGPANTGVHPDQSTVAPPATKRRIPDKAEQAKGRKVMKEALADQLKDRSIAGRRKHKVLLDEAAKTADVPNDYFILLNGAIESADGSGSLRLAFGAIEQLAASYEVDATGLKANAVAAVWMACRPAAGPSLTCRRPLMS